jgi:Na+/H+ antiporter NhaD/arsenite permease-like protein
LSSANPRPRRTRAKVSVALGICLLTLSLATAQAIRAYVPAAQLVINTGAVTQGTAPLVAVEAGLAGNLGPIASFANLLALQIARGAGVPIKRVVVLQVVVGALAFLPALV